MPSGILEGGGAAGGGHSLSNAPARGGGRKENSRTFSPINCHKVRPTPSYGPAREVTEGRSPVVFQFRRTLSAFLFVFKRLYPVLLLQNRCSDAILYPHSQIQFLLPTGLQTVYTISRRTLHNFCPFTKGITLFLLCFVS
jgi:hypothetical protein